MRDYPRISSEDRAEAVKPIHSGGSNRAAGVDTKVDRWRRENPDFFKTWTTAHGCVVQFWGMRIYYGRCKHCGGLITDRRSIQGDGYTFKSGQTQLGRWRAVCDDCRQRQQEESYTKNRKYAANYRRKMYERRGRAPHQGKPGPMTPEKWERLEQAEEHWDLYHEFLDLGEVCVDPECGYKRSPEDAEDS